MRVDICNAWKTSSFADLESKLHVLDRSMYKFDVDRRSRKLNRLKQLTEMKARSSVVSSDVLHAEDAY